MKDRIIKFLTQENLSATRFADEIGVQRSSISHILSGRNNPSFEFIQKILTRYRDLNAEWLIIGSGQMYKKDGPQPQPPVYKPTVSSSAAAKSYQQLDVFQNTMEKSNPTELPKSEKNNSIPQISPSKTVEKILVFYSDKTFDEFFPQK